MHIGEQIETIIHSRKDGKFGEYLGSSAKTFGACRIDGVIYKVERNIEVERDTPFWVVRNVNDGTVATEDEPDYLGCIRAEHFH